MNKQAEKKRRGRPKGSLNKVTGTLREAILLAGAKHGSDGKGKDGLEGYLYKVAREDMKAFSALLGRVLPLPGDASNPAHMIITTGVPRD